MFVYFTLYGFMTESQLRDNLTSSNKRESTRAGVTRMIYCRDSATIDAILEIQRLK